MASEAITTVARVDSIGSAFQKGKKYDIQSIIECVRKANVWGKTVLFVEFTSNDCHSHTTDFWLDGRRSVINKFKAFVTEHKHTEYEVEHGATRKSRWIDEDEVYTTIEYNPPEKAYCLCFTRENDADQGTTRYELTVYGVDAGLSARICSAIKPLLTKVSVDECYKVKTNDFYPCYVTLF